MTVPLEVVLCSDCALLQLTETVSPARLFSHYLYRSSTSSMLVENASAIAKKVTTWKQLSEHSLVVDIGSNDGYLLQHYQAAGIPVLGIEPAAELAASATAAGIPTLQAFFGRELGEQRRAEGSLADVIHANNVAAHVADLRDFVQGIRLLLKPDGVAIVESHYVRDLVEQAQFDSVYHEHLCYYSVASQAKLFEQQGLVMVDVERIATHGGSIRTYFQRSDGPCSWNHDGRLRVQVALSQELLAGLGAYAYYENFADRVRHVSADIRETLQKLHVSGKVIAAYGAPAKSTTLLQTIGVGRDVLRYVVDKNEAKQGRYTPGTDIPIVAPEVLTHTPPDYLLLLAWNCVDEVMEQQRAYRERGGRIIVPIPHLRIL